MVYHIMKSISLACSCLASHQNNLFARGSSSAFKVFFAGKLKRKHCQTDKSESMKAIISSQKQLAIGDL